MATFYEKLRMKSDIYLDSLLELEEKIEVDVGNLLLDGENQLMVLKSIVPYQLVGNINTCAKMLSRRLKLNYENDIMCLAWTQCMEVVGLLNIIPKLPKLMILEFDKPEFDDDDLTLLQILLDLGSPFKSTYHKIIMVVSPNTEDINEILGSFLADISMKLEFGENKKDREKKASSLIEAASWGNYHEVLRFIESGVDIAMKDEEGEAALHKAAKNGHRRVVMVLLVNNAEVGILDDRNMTPMHHACYGGFNEVVLLLIEHGASLEAVDSNGWSPLIFAAGYDHPKVVETLIVYGAEINAVTNENWTSLHVAADRGSFDAIRVLIRYGANHKLLLPDGKSAVELAMDEGFDDIADYLTGVACYQYSKM